VETLCKFTSDARKHALIGWERDKNSTSTSYMTDRPVDAVLTLDCKFATIMNYIIAIVPKMNPNSSNI